jgi:hypothetical protein
MEIEAQGARLRTEMAILRADLIKWMFLFWLGTIAVSIANRSSNPPTAGRLSGRGSP